MMIRSLEMRRLLSKLYGPDGREFSVLKGSLEWKAACELEGLEIIKLGVREGEKVMVRITREWNARAGNAGQERTSAPAAIAPGNTTVESASTGTNVPGESETPQEEPQITIEDGVQTKMVGKHKMYLNENGEWRFVV